MAIKIMIFVVILACLGPFFIKLPYGTPLMTIDDLTGGLTLDSAIDSAADEIPTGPTTVYKWQDEDGVWHFSDSPVDQHGNAVETMEVDGSVNTMQIVSEDDMKRLARAEAAKKEAAASERVQPKIPSSANPVELMDAANTLQDVMDQRARDLDTLSGKKN